MEEDELLDAFAEFNAKHPARSIELLACMLVGAIELAAETQGVDSRDEIEIPGSGDRRTITLGAKYV